MRRLGSAIGAAALAAALGPVLDAQQPPRPPDPAPFNARRVSALKPVLCESPGEAFEKAAPLGRPVLVAAGMSAESGVPPLFESPELARASRVAVLLAAADFASEDPFFKGRGVREDQVPGVLVLDAAGNLHEILPPRSEPRVILAAARNASKVAEGRETELGRVAVRAGELAGLGDAAALLEEVRPWLARHWRGYAALGPIHAAVERLGRPRLEAALRGDPAARVPALEAFARDFAHTPLEAAARVEAARLHDAAGRGDAARDLCREVLDRLPWPENAESHARAREMLARFRRDEIQRRLQELEKKP